MKKQIILLCFVLVSFLSTNQTYSQPFIGEVVIFAGNFAPRGWAFCDGQLLPIAQNSALFSILGTTYGGDGRSTFALPDLRGRAVLHAGSGPGLSSIRLGEKLGTETETLQNFQMPSHNHTATESTIEIAMSTAAGEEGTGNRNFISNHPNAFNTTTTNAAALGGVTLTTLIGNNGGNQSHNNIQPVQVVNYIIALQGVYPSRN